MIVIVNVINSCSFCWLYVLSHCRSDGIRPPGNYAPEIFIPFANVTSGDRAEYVD